ncbi:hypothetical protein CesoFtcFv8_011434 [Champsocephalus esox]|nr:hypothetical protein CesoFtcFv8_011434 [Champsocephalus esox]
MALASDVPAPFLPPEAGFFLLPNITQESRSASFPSFSLCPDPALFLEQEMGSYRPSSMELLQEENRASRLFLVLLSCKERGVWPNLLPADVTQMDL